MELERATVADGAGEGAGRKWHVVLKTTEMDRLLRLAEFLPRDEEALVRAALGDGIPARELAALAKVHERAVQRRVRRIIARVLSARFTFVASHMSRWPAQRRAVGMGVYLHGRGMRELSQSLGISFYQVRRHRDVIESQLESLGR